MVFGVSEPLLRGIAFFSVLIVLLAAEQVAPKRARVASLPRRWLTNGLLIALDNAIVRALALLAPVVAAVGAAALAGERGWGLFNNVQAPYWLSFVVTLLAFDFAIWLQHVLFHRVPALWRLHRVHHADRDIDATSALRFHPIEIVISALYKSALAVALGAPPEAVAVFEIALNACAMFNHANIALPRWLDAAVRLVLVTPDMHRVHHSIHRDEHNTNYGFCLSVWDRLFGVYRAQPRGGHDGMVIGLASHQNDAPTRLLWSLAFPFRD